MLLGSYKISIISPGGNDTALIHGTIPDSSSRKQLSKIILKFHLFLFVTLLRSNIYT